MNKLKYEKIAELNRSQADIVESFLEAEGIDVELFQESVAYSSYSTAFHTVQVYVPREMAQRARDLISSFDVDREENEE